MFLLRGVNFIIFLQGIFPLRELASHKYRQECSDKADDAMDDAALNVSVSRETGEIVKHPEEEYGCQPQFFCSADFHSATTFHIVWITYESEMVIDDRSIR